MTAIAAEQISYAPVATPEEAAVPDADTIGNALETEAENLEVAAGQQVEQLEAALPAKAEPEKMKATVVSGVALYALCSSTLLVINKVAMHLVPDAPFVLFCQFLTSAIVVRAIKSMNPDMDIELLKWDLAKPFAVATLVFFLCLLANTQALKSVNVETVIVVRSCSPIAVALLEHITLGRVLPSVSGLMALLSIAGGAAIYVVTDEGFRVEGYAWLVLYFIFIVVEMVFVKFVVETIPMSTWTRVYYNNMLSLPLAVMSAFVVGDTKFHKTNWSPGACAAVILSCYGAVAISYAGFNLRKLVSATTFTVVGVVCKVLTVLINDLIWTKHSNALGHLGLLVCIAAGFWYERAKAAQRAAQT